MKLLSTILDTRTPSMPLPFGHVENVILMSVDTSLKSPTDRKRFVFDFVQVDPTNMRKIASSRGSYWRFVTETRTPEYTFRNLMAGLITIGEALKVDLDAMFEEVFSDTIDNQDPTIWVQTNSKDKKKLLALEEAIAKAIDKYFVEAINNKPLLKLRSVINISGYFEIGIVERWILPMDSKEDLLAMTPKEINDYNQFIKYGGKRVVADSTGNPPEMASGESEEDKSDDLPDTSGFEVPTNSAGLSTQDL